MEIAKKYLKIFVSFVIAISVFIPFSLEIKAADEYSTYLNEPQVTDSSGYVVFILENNSTGNRTPYTVQFFTSSSTNYDGVNNGDEFVDITMADNKISIYFSSNTGTVTRGSVMYWRTGAVDVYNVNTTTSTSNVTWSKSFTSYTIVGFQAYGCIAHIYDNLTTNDVFTINWANDDDYSEDMQEILNILNNQETTLESLSLKLDDISSYLNTIKSNTTTIKNNTTTIKNTLTNLYNDLSTWITTQTTTISNKLDDVISAIVGNGSDNTDVDISSKNDEFTNSSNEYLELEQSFSDDLNNSLNVIDLNIDLFNGGDFLSTANFISSNIDRIVTSNQYYESFIMTGLVLGLALFLIGKRVI